VEVESERLGHLFPEVRAQAPARDLAHHLAHQEAVGEGVVAVDLARAPPGLLLGQGRRHRVPVVERVARERLAHRRETRAMREQMPHRELPLPRRSELGPVPRHRSIQVQQTGVDQTQCTDGGHSLGGRVDVHQGVARPGPRPRGVRPARPEVDDRLSLDGDADRRPELVAALEGRCKGIVNPREARIAPALDLDRLPHVRSPLRRSSPSSFHSDRAGSPESSRAAARRKCGCRYPGAALRLPFFLRTASAAARSGSRPLYGCRGDA
jgi:hypothetical protein